MATIQASSAEKPKGVGAKLMSVLGGLTGKTQEEELPSVPTYQLPSPSRPPQAVQAPFGLPTYQLPTVEVPFQVGVPPTAPCAL
jgi:hypothetical protein